MPCPLRFLAAVFVSVFAVAARAETLEFEDCLALSRQGACRPGTLARAEGVVLDVITDDIDPDWEYLVLNSHGRLVYVVSCLSARSPASLKPYLGATISVVGTFSPVNSGARHIISNTIIVRRVEDITVIHSADSDPFVAEPLGDLAELQASESLFERRRAVGRVLAVSCDGRFVLRTDEGRVVNVKLNAGDPPTYGVRAEVAGYPVSDLFRVNLTRAIWRPVAGANLPEPPPIVTTVAELLTDARGQRRVEIGAHGRAVTLTGFIRRLPGPGGAEPFAMLESDGFVVPVDASSCPEVLGRLSLGYQVRLNGICFMRTGSWSPSEPLPRIEGMTLILRTPDDVTVLSRPSWWTSGRILAVLGVLAAVLLFLLVWVVLLRRTAERRSREMLAEKLGRISSDLKVQERTRLAVELHDTLAQNLTGVSLEIDSAEQVVRDDAEETARHIARASRTLQSCRDELRNCLWDLRSRALEEDDLNVAIRRLLAPVLTDAELTIRFNISRARLADDTAYALMRIVRELVTNAIRHGHAAHIRIAGSLDDGKLMFSVQDDGTGFDPQTAPGVMEGHFGLQGIRERVRKAGGSLELDSRPGGGAKAVVTLEAATTREEES